MVRRFNGAKLVVVLWVTGIGCAQQYSFRHYGAAEGLQNLAVLSLAQDQSGFIWAGSESGLYRYDGTRFHLMSTAEGLPCVTEVQSLHVSADGALWANTCSKIFRFDGRRFQPVSGFSAMLFHSQTMADGPAGHVIVATDAGLQELAPDSAAAFTARPYLPGPGPATRRTRGILRYGSQLWFGCENRLCVAEGTTVTEFGSDHGLPADFWDAIAITPDGAVWARSSSRLFRKPSGSNRFLPEAFALASSMYWGAIAADPDGTVMVPTDEGLAISRNGRWNVIGESRGLRTSLTIASLRDRDGSLWVGLAGGGLARCLGCGEWESWTKTQGLPSNLIWNILRDRRGSLWVGTGAGLTRFDGAAPARTWTRATGLTGDNIRWLGETADGAIWTIAVPGGLARVDPASGRIRPVGKSEGLDSLVLRRGLIDHAGRIWIACDAGIFRNDSPAASVRFVKVDWPGDHKRGSWSIAEDRQQTIWVAAQDGLWRLKDGQWRSYHKADGLLSDDPYIIAVAPDNTLYLRHRFDPTLEHVEFEGDRILRSTPVHPVASSTVDISSFHGFDAAGNLWLGAANGVAVLRDRQWTKFTTEDGLVWNDCDGEAFWADPDGSVWFGTSGGLAHFRPPQQPPSIPAPIVSSLEVRGRQRLVRASFSSLNFRYEQVLQFAYRLDEGLWIETPERSMSIAGMSPGWHRLEIRSRVREGPYSPVIASARFHVAPLWWESWWFRGIGLLVVAALVVGIVWWRHWLLRQRNLALEQAVRERTAELEAERLKVLEQKRRADAASEAKGQFLAHMSHEIRTPLNGLLGLSALLGDTRDPQESQETIRLIQSSGQTLLRVINDVLDFSKVEAGKLELELAPFPLRTTLEDAVGMFRPRAAEKKLRLATLLASDVPEWVTGDITRLRQVILNLISNALKFTACGEIVLSAMVESCDEAGHSIRFEVRDTGIGIPPDRISHLFASFSQADSSISRRFGGTGLGLVISQRLVDLMGGVIAVESTPGVGTTFHFTLPLGRAATPASTESAVTLAPANYNLKVLLVEDNKVNQKVGLRLLQKLGIDADMAEDGSQAIQAALRNTYDLILMDIQMPGIDGIAATKDIRAQAPHQPYICGLSAHATIAAQQQCLEAGMNGYLTKPLDFQKLRSLLEELEVGQALRPAQ